MSPDVWPSRSSAHAIKKRVLSVAHVAGIAILNLIKKAKSRICVDLQSPLTYTCTLLITDTLMHIYCLNKVFILPKTNRFTCQISLS